MARQSLRLSKIVPADIIAENRAITDDAYELFDIYPSELHKLEYAIATAVTAQLPDELIVHETSYQDPDSTEPTRVWLVLQGMDPATTKVTWRGLEDDTTNSLQDAIAWLSDLRRVAEAINLSDLVREATRHAELALQADA